MADSPDRVTLRYTPRQLATMLVVFVVLFYAAGLLIRTLGGSGAGLGTVILIVVVWMLLSWFGVGTRLTPHEIRNLGLTGRSVPWDDVTSIDEVATRGARTLEVKTRSSRTLRLLVPSTGRLVRDPDFDERAAVVRQWWQAYATGATPPAGAPDQSAGNPWDPPRSE